MREFDHTVRSVVGLHPRVAGVMMHLVMLCLRMVTGAVI